MSTLAQDTFRRADGALGTPWTSHPLAGISAAIDTYRVRASTSATVLAWHGSVSAVLDCTVSAEVRYLGGSTITTGVVGRLSESAATFYSARMNNNGAIELIKSVTGTITVLGSFTSVMAVGAFQRISLRMNGSTIQALQNGNSVISVTDTSIATAGRVGIRMTGAGSNTTGMHLDSWSANDYLISPPAIPSASDVLPNFTAIQRENFDVDVERGDFDTVKSGSDQGLLDPSTPGGSVYSPSFKTKATGPIPNETDVDYDIKLTTWVADGIFTTEMFWHTDGRAKGAGYKPIPYPNKISQTYGRYRYAYRLSDSGSASQGFGSVFDFISPDTWAAGSGEYGHPEQGAGNPTGKLGSYIRASDHVADPNRNNGQYVVRRNYDGTVTGPSDRITASAFAGTAAPSGMNDWHVGEAIFEPGRTRLLSDGVVIWDDTVNPVSDPMGFVFQDGKPGNPTVGSKAQVEIAWVAIDSYTGGTPTPVATLESRITALATALGQDFKLVVKKGELSFNVKDYGAKGDGTTDDTTSVTSCFNAARAARPFTTQRPKVLFPMGVYITSAAVTAAGLVIEGYGATIKAKAGITGFNFFVAFGTVSIFGLTIDGNKANTTAPAGPTGAALGVYIHMASGGYVGELTDVTIINNHGPAVRISSVVQSDSINALQTRVTANNVTVDNSGYGFWINGGSDVTISESRFTNIIGEAIWANVSKNVVVDSCYINITGGQGISDNYCYASRFTKNYINNAGYAGIAIGGGSVNWVISRRFTLSDNVIENAYFHGITMDVTVENAIYTSQPVYGTVTGNTINNCGKGASNGNGIYLVSTGFVTVTGNICMNNYSGGIAVFGRNNVITGNICHGNGMYGIELRGHASATNYGQHMLSNNSCANNGTPVSAEKQIYIHPLITDTKGSDVVSAGGSMPSVDFLSDYNTALGG